MDKTSSRSVVICARNRISLGIVRALFERRELVKARPRAS